MSEFKAYPNPDDQSSEERYEAYKQDLNIVSQLIDEEIANNLSLEPSVADEIKKAKKFLTTEEVEQIIRWKLQQMALDSLFEKTYAQGGSTGKLIKYARRYDNLVNEWKNGNDLTSDQFPDQILDGEYIRNRHRDEIVNQREELLSKIGLIRRQF